MVKHDLNAGLNKPSWGDKDGPPNWGRSVTVGGD